MLMAGTRLERAIKWLTRRLGPPPSPPRRYFSRDWGRDGAAQGARLAASHCDDFNAGGRGEARQA